MDWFRTHILTPFYKQDRTTQARVVLFLFIVACLVAFLSARNIYHTAGLEVLGTDANWNAVQRSQVISANLRGGIVCYLLGVGLGIIGYKFWVRTATGRASCQWNRDENGLFNESDRIQAAKIHNQGRLQVAWILGSLLFFGLVLHRPHPTPSRPGPIAAASTWPEPSPTPKKRASGGTF